MSAIDGSALVHVPPPTVDEIVDVPPTQMVDEEKVSVPADEVENTVTDPVA
jgi:hypothetical protein